MMYCTVNICRKLTQKEFFELNALKHKCAQLPSNQLGEDHLASLSWKGFHSTGLYYDIPQVCEQSQ